MNSAEGRLLRLTDSGAPGVAAHLIVGSREEPFLAALLESLIGVADRLIVNDNAEGTSPHREVLSGSWFARNERIVVDRTPFVDFSAARNRCLALHREHAAGAWVAFVDADEVHGEAARRIARHLALVPPNVDFLDGYTTHFFGSFDFYTSIERRMMFFRFSPDAHWTGAVHEQLHGLGGGRVALPYLYAHYGHVLPARRYAEKQRQYIGLGHAAYRDDAGAHLLVPPERLDEIDVAEYFKETWPLLLPFTKAHPAAALATIAVLRARHANAHSRAEALVRAAQNPWRRARNGLIRLNYEWRWRGRALQPLSRRLLAP